MRPDEPAVAEQLLAGQVVGGRFVVSAAVGSGGMATVYRATDLFSGNEVALKVARRAVRGAGESLVREASLLATLAHPGIVGHVGDGRCEDGRPFVALRWLAGETLGARLLRGPLALPDVFEATRQIAQALAYLQEGAVVHGDVKPENILATTDGRFVLLDFGIACRAGMRDDDVPPAAAGTAGYVAPEALRGTPSAGAPRDIFSLGCLAFATLVGRPPFQRDSVARSLEALLHEEVPRLETLVPSTPASFARLVSAMLARAPSERPTAAAVGAELDAMEDEVHASSARQGLATKNGMQRERRRTAYLVIGGAAAGLEHVATDLAKADGPLRVEGHGAGWSMAFEESPTLVADLEALARLALAVRRHAPAARMSIACRLSSPPLSSPASDDGRADLPEVAGLIALDAMAAALLRRRFRVADREGGPVLHGEAVAMGPPAHLLGQRTPFVGRADEVNVLASHFRSVVQEPRARMDLVAGLPGVGKSRLVYEIVKRLDDEGHGAQVLFAAARTSSAAIPLGLLRQCIEGAAAIVPEDDLEARRAKVERRVRQHIGGGDGERIAPFMGELAGVPFSDAGNPALHAARAHPQLMEDRMRAAWHDWLAAETRRSPVIIVIEDLHDADLGTKSFLKSALRHLERAPLWLLATAAAGDTRDGSVEDLLTASTSDTLLLGPLPGDACDELARAVLGPEASRAAEALLVQAQGNPLYLEELIRAAHDGHGKELPSSVLEMIRGRIDAEHAEARLVLRAASVLGHRFRAAGVKHLIEATGGAVDPMAWLGHLRDRELLREMAAGDAETATYEFAHPSLCDASYSTLTPDDRRLAHLAAAHWLARTEMPEAVTVAEHFRRAGDTDGAASWYARAAARALRANDLRGALKSVEIAVDVVGGEAGAAARLRSTLGEIRAIEAEAHLWCGELALAGAAAGVAADALEAGEAAWLQAIASGVIVAGKQAEWDQVSAWVARATSFSPPQDACDALATTLAWASVFLIFGGRYDEADELTAMVADLAGLGGDVDPEVEALLCQSRAVRASVAGDLAGCLQHLERARASFEKAGDLRNLCAARTNLAFVHMELGELERAVEGLEQALAEADRMGLDDVKSIAFHNLGRALALQGDLAAGERMERMAVERLAEEGERRLEALSRVYLAEILAATRALDEAVAQATQAVSALEANPGLKPRAWAALATAFSAKQEREQALEAAQAAWEMLEAQGTVEEGDALIRLRYAECLAACAQADDAAAVISQARAKLLARAEKISDPGCRARFLAEVAENARTLALAETWSRPSGPSA